MPGDTSDEAPQSPSVLGVNHITIRTVCLESSLKFYTQVLNMRLVHRGRSDAYLEAGSLWLCLLERNGQPDNDTVPANVVDHIALTVTTEAFREFERRIRVSGCRIEREPVQRGDGFSFCFRSPEGLVWEIHTGTLRGRLADWK